MIFGYMKIAEPKITHAAAYHREDLRSKRMVNQNPNGNIITDAAGNYSRFDLEVHKKQFSKIQKEYAIGDPANSRFLDDHVIRLLAPNFVSKLAAIFKVPTFQNQIPFNIITRKGQQLDANQAQQILTWLNSVPNRR